MVDNIWLRKGCIQFICPLFPRCVHAAGDCCDITDVEDRELIAPEECLQLNDKPLFQEKPARRWRTD